MPNLSDIARVDWGGWIVITKKVPPIAPDRQRIRLTWDEARELAKWIQEQQQEPEPERRVIE